jgi:hypothetical protein
LFVLKNLLCQEFKNDTLFELTKGFSLEIDTELILRGKEVDKSDIDTRDV